MQHAGFFDELHHAGRFRGIAASGFSHAIAFSLAPCLIAATMRSMFSTRAKFGPHSQMQSIDSSATIDSIDPNAFASPTRSDRDERGRVLGVGASRAVDAADVRVPHRFPRTDVKAGHEPAADEADAKPSRHADEL